MSPVVGVALAGVLATVGLVVGWLTAGGAAAASIVGAAVFVGGGWVGAAWLAFFFVSGSALGDRSIEPTASHRGRAWRQVVANGGWAAVGMVLVLGNQAAGWAVTAGSLAAATADTWSTELGTRFGRSPVLISTGRPVAPGTSGAVTVVGTAGGIAGALALALLVGFTQADPSLAVAAFIGGGVGMVVDSIAGATVQGGYFCEDCQRATEAPRRHTGHRWRQTRGWRLVDNDVVNLVGTGLGAAVTVALA